MLTPARTAAEESFFDGLRSREFSRLDASGHAYLDYAATALYGESQVRAHADLLQRGIFGNPHSDHSPSRAAGEAIDGAREAVLRFFNVTRATHAVSFTANATAAIKLVAESFPFGRDSACVLSADNHNSVNGLREFARARGAHVTYLPLDSHLRLQPPGGVLSDVTVEGPSLLALPAQSNFSGVKHPLSLVAQARTLGFTVLLDAAAFAPTNALDLGSCPADFVAISFYKIFGYPTGIGALVARRASMAALRRPWFAGGTVAYASVQAGVHRLHADETGFEDGTPDFLALAALTHGFALIDEVGIGRLSAHVSRLRDILLGELRALRHANGTPLVKVYGPADTCDRGATIAFNVLDRRGRPIPYGHVESRARAANLAVRGGCFCNPGAAEAAFGFEESETNRCLRTLGPDFSVERFAACLGPDIEVGAVRASIGLANNREDVFRCVEVVDSFREA